MQMPPRQMERLLDFVNTGHWGASVCPHCLTVEEANTTCHNCGAKDVVNVREVRISKDKISLSPTPA